mmetsp:Transcript_1302/g.4003  ORF Transcript_1302/g.4003 Transcript_1302/m.4003 type:complete len:124 (-) Transcript_1302:636-1007(-)
MTSPNLSWWPLHPQRQPRWGKLALLDQLLQFKPAQENDGGESPPNPVLFTERKAPRLMEELFFSSGFPSDFADSVSVRLRSEVPFEALPCMSLLKTTVSSFSSIAAFFATFGVLSACGGRSSH